MGPLLSSKHQEMAALGWKFQSFPGNQEPWVRFRSSGAILGILDLGGIIADLELRPELG